MKKKLLLISTTVFISLIIVLVGMELIARMCGENDYVLDERNIVFRYDKELGWFPIANISKQFKGGSRVIHVKHNKDGFRDVEHGSKKKKRIAFLGDSYVWGFDVEYGERFTEYLQKRLPDWEMINMGVNGYSTDQEWILIQNWFDKYQPDIVFLVFCDNDWYGNTTNFMHRYYKPYFTITDGKLDRQGTPVGKSVRYIISKYPLLMKSRLAQYIVKYTRPKRIHSNDPSLELILKIRSFVESKGAKFFLAFTDDKGTAERCSVCKSKNIPYLLLTNDLRYEKKGNHWTPEGHEFVSNKIYELLQLRNIVPD